MILVKSFVGHFNLVKWIRGDRNHFNRSYRTIFYRFSSVCFWILLIPFKLLDLLGFYYLIDGLRRLFFATRRLSDFEIEEAKKVFGESIKWSSIRIRENSWMARVGARSAKKVHIGFVLFRTVNFSRELNHERNTGDMPWLIHELVHVLQFKYLGVQYVLEALRAQQTAGYDYDGLNGLGSAKGLESFNLEQQADIARDYYKALLNNKDDSVYRPLIAQLKEGKL